MTEPYEIPAPHPESDMGWVLCAGLLFLYPLFHTVASVTAEFAFPTLLHVLDVGFLLVWIPVAGYAVWRQTSRSALLSFNPTTAEVTLLLSEAGSTSNGPVIPFADFVQVALQGAHSDARRPRESHWHYRVVCLYRDGDRTLTLRGSQTWAPAEYQAGWHEASFIAKLLGVGVVGGEHQVYKVAEDGSGWVIDAYETERALPPSGHSGVGQELGASVFGLGCGLLAAFIFLGFVGSSVRTIGEVMRSSATTRQLEQKRREQTRLLSTPSPPPSAPKS